MAADSQICKDVPSRLASFVDTFVDFSVSGFFLPPPPNPTNSSNQTRPPPPSPLQTRYPPPPRLVAVGDLHGDLTKSKQALRLAGLIDDSDRWTGGNTTVVQIGDVLDRGGEELKILYFLERLKRQASRCGGSIITMIGNHEIMNMEGDFRFVTQSALNEFKIWSDWFQIGNSMKNLCLGLSKPKNIFDGIPSIFSNVKQEYHAGFRARVSALRPGGPVSSRFFSENPTVLVIGESVFAHGGVLKDHVVYGLEKINQEVRDWINGLTGKKSPYVVRGRDSIVWCRRFSANNSDCSMLEHVLATIPGAKRMIMGHTIQNEGINGVCENKAIRIDVGMSKGCGDGLPEVLEINRNSELRIFTSNQVYAAKAAKTNEKDGVGFLMPEHRPVSIQVNA